MVKRNRIWMIIPLVVLALAVLACLGSGSEPVQYKDVGAAINSMQVIYARVYNGTLDAWTGANTFAPFLWAVFWFLLAGGVVTIVAASTSGNINGALVAGLVGAVAAALIAGVVVSGNLQKSWPQKAEQQAVNEMTNGVSAARHNKANQYLEYLNVPVVKVDRVWQECEQRNNAKNSCGDYVPEWTYEHNPREVCDSRDDKGNCKSSHWEHDTMHVPYIAAITKDAVYVSLLDRLVADSPETGLEVTEGKADMPHRYLTDWYVPEDFKWVDVGRTTDVSGYVRGSSVQWRWFYDQLYNQGVSVKVSVPHIYLNWFFTADAEQLIAQSPVIDRYLAAGLLPGMSQLYSRNGHDWQTDLDCVQFLGGLQVSQSENDAFQARCDELATVFGNLKQGVVTVVFAPAESITSYDEWADAAKANYSIKEKWPVVVVGENRWQMLPKNAFLLFCGVRADRSIDQCRLRTGMPKGNEAAIVQIAAGTTPEMQGLMFDADDFFGGLTVFPIDKGEGVGLPELSFGSQHGPIWLMMRDPASGGIKREKMGEYQWLEASIVLETAEVEKIITDGIAVQAAAASWAVWFPFWLIVSLVGVAGAVFFLATNR